jgi:hypothetical protein
MKRQPSLRINGVPGPYKFTGKISKVTSDVMEMREYVHAGVGKSTPLNDRTHQNHINCQATATVSKLDPTRVDTPRAQASFKD